MAKAKETTETIEPTDEFNLASPTLAPEGEGIAGFDPNASANQPPRPPRAGTYLLQGDFVESEEAKRFQYGTKADPDKDYMSTNIRFTITGVERLSHGDALAYEEKYWMARKVGGGFGVAINSLPVAGQKGTSWIGEFCKAYGKTARDLAAAKGHANSYKETGFADLITECIASGQQIRAFLDWEWKGKTESLVNPADGKPYYIRKSWNKQSPLNAVPQGMKAFPLDHEKDEYPYSTQALVITNGDTITGFELQPSPEALDQAIADGNEAEIITLYAELKVERFMPPKK
jgi:hypothetical protein